MPITNVTRLLPRIGPAHHAERVETVRSASLSSGYPNPCLSSKAACLSTESPEMPTTLGAGLGELGGEVTEVA